ncbi:MAG: hypothetical protein ACREL5_01085, partial [Gemmatimonadales bacterium]
FTFTPQIETEPRLAPGGELVAFIRARDTLPVTPRLVVLMDLIAGTEFPVKLPAAAGRPLTIAWSGDSALDIRAQRGIWRARALGHGTPVPVTGTDSVAADSTLALWLGKPRFAQVIRCAGGGVCVRTIKGDTGELAPQGRDAFAWGRDSVAWFEGNDLYVRSFGPGLPRRVPLDHPPAHPRDGSYSG